MPNLTNIGDRARGLPNGRVLDVGASAPVQASVLENETVQRWIKLGFVTSDATVTTPEPDEDEGDEKDALIAALAEYGVTKNRRSSVESLKAALAEAKAAEEESE